MFQNRQFPAMFQNRRLLSAVSAAVLTVATNGAALSNTRPDAVDQVLGASSIRIDEASDLIVELLDRTGGTVTPASVDRALRSMFAPLTRAEAETLPALMRSIRGLGWKRDVEVTAAEVMADLIAGSPELSGDADSQLTIAALVGASGPVLPIRIAQAAPTDLILCIYRPEDPRYRLDPNCPPLETGALPPTSTGTIGGY